MLTMHGFAQAPELRKTLGARWSEMHAAATAASRAATDLILSGVQDEDVLEVNNQLQAIIARIVDTKHRISRIVFGLEA